MYYVSHLIGRRFQRGTRQMLSGRTSGQTGYYAPRIRVPSGRAQADERGRAVNTGMVQQGLGQNDAPFGIEGKLMGVAEDRGGKGVVFIGEGIELVDTGGQAFHQVDAAAVNRRVNERGPDDDAVEGLASQHQAKRRRH